VRRLVFLLLLVAAACSSSDKAPDPVVVSPGTAPARKDRPYVAHWDVLETSYLSRGDLPAGVDAVWAPIHSSTNTTLFFVAFQKSIPRYVNPEHEETFFIVSGSGTLDLSGKARPIEGGFVVRVPPGFAHGFTAKKGETIEALLVVAPTMNQPSARAQDTDVPDATGIVYCQDIYAENVPTLPKGAPFPRLKAFPDPDMAAAFLDQSRYSTLQLAAVGRARIPDHYHASHDETAILFAQKGLGFMRLNDLVDPAQEIQVFHIPAGTVHSYEHKAEGHGRAISIFTPGYDGTDKVLVAETKELKTPQGYKKTYEDSGWQQDGRHAVPGDSVAPRPDEPIRGVPQDR
jgi:quercetin dioxygenase-like cupin family protein